MSKVSNSYLSIFVKLLFLLALAKSIALALWWFLPDDGVSLKEHTNFNPPYHRITFKNMLTTKSVQKHTIVQANGISITNMILKGLYGNKKEGFIIVALKSSPRKTSLVSVGKEYSGYRLKSIFKDGVLFVKNGKEFILKIKNKRNSANSHSSIVKVQNEDSVHNVSRQDIRYYEKHPNQIWRDISIMERKNGKKIDGFRVTRVRRGSKMDTLGLKRGDIIIKANNVDLNSYKSVFDLYKNISNIDTLQLVVLRDNEEKELVYEIH